MRRPSPLTPLLSVLLLAASAALGASRPAQCTHEMVPASHWSYTALRELTTGNRVPGLTPVRFLGDFAFDRSELAEMAWTCWETLRADPRARGRVWLGPLLREYGGELETAGRPVAEALAGLAQAEAATIQGHGIARAEWTNHGTCLTGRLGAIRISRAGDAVARIELAHQPTDARQQRLGQPLLATAALDWLRPQYRLTLGRDALRMGVGARGTFGWDDTHGPSDHARYESVWRVLGTRIGVEFTWTAALRAGQLVTTYTKRYEKRLSDHLEVSLTDIARMRGVTSPVYMVLPVSFWGSLLRHQLRPGGVAYYEDNLLMHSDLVWSPPGRLRVYAEAAIDEVDMPEALDSIGIYRLLLWLTAWLGVNGDEPGRGEDENAWLLGVYSPDLFDNGRWAARAEYARSSRQFGLSGRSEVLDFIDRGVPLQHRIGPDAHSLYLEARYLASGDLAAKAYLERIVRGRVQPVPSHEWAFGLSVTKGLGHDAAARLALTHREVRGPLAGERDRSTTLSVGLESWF